MSFAFMVPQPLPGAGFLSAFPVEWRTDVVVHRSGGRDAKDNPRPADKITVHDCMVGPRATSDPLDRSDVVDAKAVLYNDTGFTFLSTDRITVPRGSLMAGEWKVDGRPGEWHMGVEIGLVRA